jgi:hypothetical protein
MKQLSKVDKVVLGLIAIVVIALLVMILAEVYHFGVDDSFIFYRYAQNAGEAHGFRFNLNEPAGEGFTSWMWMILLTLCHFVGASLVPASKILGIIFHLSSGIILFLLVRQILGKETVATFTGMALAAGVWLNYRLIAHSVSGMETPLYLFFILLLVYLTTRAIQAPADHLYWWGVTGLAAMAAFWARPEGIAAGAISLLALTIAHPRALLKIRTWGYLFAGLILPMALFLGMKYLVFGYIMPHSYYHKVIVNTNEYSASLQHLIRFAKSYWWLIAAAGLSALYGIFFRKKTLYLYYGFLFAAMTGAYLFFYPVMNYLHRFYIPYLPLLLLLLLPALDSLNNAFSHLKSHALKLVPLLAIFAALALALNTQLAPTRIVIDSWSKMVNPQIYRARLGKLMAELPADVIVANAEMGVIPYYSRLTCIDMAGLTDPHIAHRGLSMSYLEKRNVQLILFPKEVEKMSAQQWRKYTINYKGVFLSKRFKRDFRRIASFAAWPGGVNKYYIYADTTSPHFDAIRQWLNRYAKEFKITGILAGRS